VICETDIRRETVREHTEWNGLDELEVNETGADTGEKRPLLTVSFLGKLGAMAERIGVRNVRITGGRRITSFRVLSAVPRTVPETDLDDTLEVVLDRAGDFSTYTFELVRLDEFGQATDQPLEGIDPRYARIEFGFRPDCPSDLDCAVPAICPPEEFLEPEINYLAKDFSSFKQLIYDRLALTIPDWRERHVPDLGVALVELFAYVGDHLSYQQDAVATEAYLETARQRISVRRHARLVDYAMHEGCNARAFVHLEVSQDTPLETAAISFVTGLNDGLGLASGVLGWEDLRNISSERYEVFEPITNAREFQFFQAHNEIEFYTWGENMCCLSKGATAATLKDDWVFGQENSTQQDSKPPKDKTRAITTEPRQRTLHLEPGDLLIFEEVIGPRTGNPADANPRHRHAVRLTRITPGLDALFNQPVLEIEWHSDDALPFDLCLSSRSDAPDCREIEGVSVAHGNVILVDHGRRRKEDLGTVPVESELACCDDCGCGDAITLVPGRFRPHLERTPLTHAQMLGANFSASKMLRQNVRDAMPAVKLSSAASVDVLEHHLEFAQHWQAQRDLLASGASDRHFVAELDNDGVAHLRFGDGELGAQPDAGHVFRAFYRVGNGPRGNVGAEAISHLLLEGQTLSGISVRVRNPLPATGGTKPETIEEVKRFAPFAMRETLKRAITPDDYARLAQELFPLEVFRAAASARWTGSVTEMLVVIDPIGRAEADQNLLERIQNVLEKYRKIGHELRVDRARLVPLELELEVCVQAHFVRGHVKAALLERFSNRILANGKRGFFHPDNLSFGEGISVSTILANAQSIPGVDSVKIMTLKRYGQVNDGSLERGLLALEALEVAQLENDPSQPEDGVLKLVMRGGR
jgi:hypothetical protein